MAQAGGSGAKPQRHSDALLALERDAHGVADRLPDLLIEAKRIAATVAHGIHGRRRAGPGETFWQFRQLQATDSSQLIDWRRSASTDHLYVREREWEAAHTLWLWCNLSKSMDFRSHLTKVSKRDRAVVLMLASAELLVRSGERIGLLGVTVPTASRKAATKLAEAMASPQFHDLAEESQPPKARLSRFSSAVLFSDFLDPIDTIRAHIEVLASSGVTGHLIQVLDPAEETLPYQGRTEFLSPDGSQRWLADRVETMRARYQDKLAGHRAEIVDLATRLGWTFMVHHTDRPASEPLLTLTMRLEGRDGGYRAVKTSTLGGGP
jgi:uncharacterized protein (DUF58 family)